MGGQLDGNFLPGSLPHKFILIVTLIICFVVNKFLSPSFCRQRTVLFIGQPTLRAFLQMFTTAPTVYTVIIQVNLR